MQTPAEEAIRQDATACSGVVRGITTTALTAAPFADRVVHHALCNLMAPVLEQRFHARSFSCQKGKGTTAARECVRTLVNRHRFVLKCDVRKFFESIDHEILCQRLFRIFHCPGVRQITRLIVDSHATPEREHRGAAPRLRAGAARSPAEAAAWADQPCVAWRFLE